MLKKAGIAAAVAVAGLLALSPFAIAAEDQDNHQFSFQGQGVEESNGQNEASGGSFQEGCQSQAGPNNLLGEVIPPDAGTVNQDAVTDASTGTCEGTSTVEGQTEEQHRRNH